MGEQLTELGTVRIVHRSAWWLALPAALGGVALCWLWWVDPRQLALPLCMFHHLTGLHCPGCGAIRATHELLNGRLLAAMHYNVLWVLALPPVLYAAASETRRFVLGRPLPGNPIGRPWFLITLAALAVLFGLLRNVPGYPFELLAPPV
ncbi:MAG: hypothetical protein A2V70_19190 [Planctomycetes bacterium RBG_13_63_9]|nr:MAG: hypothetical protein A2V70_19190 [Planctomycetes bacterium RBG_13_63_9]